VGVWWGGGGVGGGGFWVFCVLVWGGGGGGGGMDFAKNFFGGGDDSAPPDQEIKISLKDVLSGCRKKVKIYRKKECEKCLGMGKTKNENPVGLFGSSEINCTVCFGTGKMCDPLTGVSDTLFIPNGVKNGRIIPKGGNLFKIVYKKHPIYEPKDTDLHAEITVRWIDAILSRPISIEWLDYSEFNIMFNTDKPVVPGTLWKIPGKGLPKESSTIRGDLFVRIQITYPSTVDDKTRKVLNIIYPPLKEDYPESNMANTVSENKEEGGNDSGCCLM